MNDRAEAREKAKQQTAEAHGGCWRRRYQRQPIPTSAEDGGGAAPEADDAGQRAWGDAAPPLSDVVKKALDEAVNKETLALEMLKCCPPDQLLQALEPNKGLVWPIQCIHDLLDVETLEKVGGVMGVPVPRTSSARTWATKAAEERL
ncbi:hypothetical protein AB1Y20_002530 [Prymnesium parvum]|uniref:Uncharacterized protein n=1 Tax=Prymnesium parvum TaxID=97485 RepID=A0AB34JB44_PRYPA